MLKSYSMIIALFIFWIILSGQWTVFFITTAIGSVCFTIWVDKKLFPSLSIKPKLKWLILIIKLFTDMLISSFSVMKIIWLNQKISSSVAWVDNIYSEKFAQIAYANAITLTPGTMSMDLKNDKILVHTLKVKL